MTTFEPLWALGLDDMIAIVIFLLFIVIPAVGQLLAKLNKPKRPPQGQRGQPRRPQAAVPAGGNKVEDEIAEFLRRAAQGRAPQGGPAQAPPPPPPRPQPARPVAVDVVAQQPIRAEVVEPRRFVKPSIDTGDIAQHASSLGSEVAQADEEIEDRLHHAFDHQVGELPEQKERRRAQPQEEAAPLVAPVGFAALLSNNENIRQAIVISEILNRPVDRWV